MIKKPQSLYQTDAITIALVRIPVNKRVTKLFKLVKCQGNP